MWALGQRTAYREGQRRLLQRAFGGRPEPSGSGQRKPGSVFESEDLQSLIPAPLGGDAMAPHKIDVGVGGGITPPIENVVKFARLNEEQGYHSIWFPDHLM